MLERCFESFGVKIYYLKKMICMYVCVSVCASVCVYNAVTFFIFIQSFLLFKAGVNHKY